MARKGRVRRPVATQARGCLKKSEGCMCGIALSVGGKDATTNRLHVVNMLHDMVSRGDCVPSMESHGTCALGCVRLAIVDELGGCQPMFNASGDIAVVFN